MKKCWKCCIFLNFGQNSIFFHFWVKFGSKPLVALGKRLYQKIWRGSESIALKLSEGVFNLFFGANSGWEKSEFKVLNDKKRRFLYKKSSRKRGVHDIVRKKYYWNQKSDACIHQSNVVVVFSLFRLFWYQNLMCKKNDYGRKKYFHNKKHVVWIIFISLILVLIFWNVEFYFAVFRRKQKLFFFQSWSKMFFFWMF